MNYLGIVVFSLFCRFKKKIDLFNMIILDSKTNMNLRSGRKSIHEKPTKFIMTFDEIANKQHDIILLAKNKDIGLSKEHCLYIAKMNKLGFITIDSGMAGDNNSTICPSRLIIRPYVRGMMKRGVAEIVKREIVRSTNNSICFVVHSHPYTDNKHDSDISRDVWIPMTTLYTENRKEVNRSNVCYSPQTTQSIDELKEEFSINLTEDVVDISFFCLDVNKRFGCEFEKDGLYTKLIKYLQNIKK